MTRAVKILVVDEEPQIGRLIEAALEDSGHTVRAVPSEAEAIAALVEPFDVLILHRQLPDAACHELVRLARQQADPAVILLSSQQSLETERNMLRLGAAEILYKPLDPLAIRACVERHGQRRQQPDEVPGRPRVLVVDDEPMVLVSVKDILLEDYEVQATDSPYRALELLRQSPFEILLSDLMMDELPGIELIRAARNTRPALQTIVMTGYASKSTAVEALKEGVYDFLEKPLTPDIVRQTVARAWKSLRYEIENRKLLAALRQQLQERDRLLAERQTLIVDLESKSSKLERFTYAASHDLKAPLITIKGFLGLLKKDIETGNAERLEHDIRRIGTAVDTMHELLEGLLDLSRVGYRIDPSQKVSMSELAREAFAKATSRFPERQPEVVIQPDLPILTGDRAMLSEVLQNLLENAVKFLGDQPSPRIEIGGRSEDGNAVFYVRDNGIGIEPRFQSRIFTLFERLDLQVEGAGIGLAMVKRIVEGHGGRVWVESQGNGRGSTFYFSLPERTIG